MQKAGKDAGYRLASRLPVAFQTWRGERHRCKSQITPCDRKVVGASIADKQGSSPAIEALATVSTLSIGG